MGVDRGIFTVDGALIVRTWDGWLSRVTGIDAEAACGRALTQVIPDLQQRGLLRKFQSTLETGAVEILTPAFHHFLIPCPTTAPSRTFQNMQQRVTIAPLKDGERIAGLIVSVEDVTTLLSLDYDVEELGSSDWRVRQAAVESAAKFADASTVPLLISTIRQQHRNPGILNSVIQVLAQSGWDTVPALTQLVSDADPEVRMYAVLTLGERNDKRAVPALIRGVRDSSVNVRYHAIEALGRLRSPEAVDVLLEAAMAQDFFLAFPAIEALGAIGDSRVVPAIVPLLSDPALVLAVTDALGTLGDATCVPALTEILAAPDSPVEGIATALSRLHERYETMFEEGAFIADQVRHAMSPAATQRLLDALERADNENTSALAKVLGWLESEDVHAALARLLSHPEARKEVVISLVRYGSRVTPLLVKQLNSESLETRQAAVVALGRIGDRDAVPALIEALENDDTLAVPVATALAKIGDRRAFEALLKLIGHPTPTVRRAVVAAINSLGHPGMAQRAAALLADPDPLVRESAVRIAGYFGYPSAADAIFQCCDDEVDAVRRTAIEHLPYMEDPRVLPRLKTALQEDTATIRAAAAHALSSLESRESSALLVQALQDEDSWVRFYAARSLGRLKCSEAVEALAEVVNNDAADHTKITAATAIGEIGGPLAIATLTPLVRHENHDLARTASMALAHLGVSEALGPLVDLLKNSDVSRKFYAVRALGAMGGEQAVDALEWVAATDEDPRLSQEAIEQIAEIGTPTSTSALIRLTSDRRLRDTAIQTLTRKGANNIEAIGKALRESNVHVRKAMVDVLARMKHPEASTVLLAALDDEDASIRLSAVSAFGRLGSHLADKKLVDVAHRDKDPVVKEAARALLQRTRAS